MLIATRTTTKVLTALFATLTCSTVLAHSGADSHQHLALFSGFLHPFTGLDHMATMIAIGLWSALIARRFGREMLWGPLGFANLLLVGAALGLQGAEIPGVEPMIAASLVLTGLLVVSRLPLRGSMAAMLVGVFALFHGLAHGHAIADNIHAFQTLAGMVCATLLLHTMGLALGWSLRGANVWVPRLLGGAIALLGGTLLQLGN